MLLQPWQQRVIAEEADITAKMAMLRDFLDNDQARYLLAQVELDLLIDQYAAMRLYRSILRQRIHGFKEES